MRLNDLALGLLVAAFGAAILVSSAWFSPIPGQAYGADTMPMAIGIASTALGAFIVVKAVAAGARAPAAFRSDWARRRRDAGAFLLTLALIGFYVVFAPIIGFAPAATAIMLALMLTLGVGLGTAVLIALGAAAAIQFAFGRMLLVPLPRSPLLDWIG